MLRSHWVRVAGLFILGAGIVSCTRTIIPEYIESVHPYTKEFYGNFDQVYAATRRALDDMGWKVAKATKPSVFEYDTAGFPGKSVLLFTKSRETDMVVGSRYARMNIIIRSRQGVSDLEVRYLTVSSFPVKTFRSYRNDAAVQRLFARIEHYLVKPGAGPSA